MSLEDISYADRIRRLVKHHEPGKQKSTEATIEKFAGKEKALLNTLVKKMGEEPPLTDAEKKEIEEKKKQNSDGSKPSSPKESTSTPASPAAASGSPTTDLVIPKQPKTLDDLPYEERIRRLMKLKDPTKAKATENTITKFKGKEKALLNTLAKKYEGGEPELTADEKGNYVPVTPQSTPPPATETTAPPAAASPDDATKKDGDKKDDADDKDKPFSALSEAEKEKKRKGITLNDMQWKDRIERYVKTYEPEKVSTVPQTMIEYKGKEEALLKSLVSKHGEEPKITEAEIDRILDPPPPEPTEEEKKKMQEEEEEKKKKEAEEGGEKKDDEDRKILNYDDDEEANKKKKEPNPYQDAFDIQPRPPSPKPVSIDERIRRMAIHYDPKSLDAVNTALAKKKKEGKEQELLDLLINQHGPEPDYSRCIVSSDIDSLALAPPFEGEDIPKSFGETYSRILDIVKANDQEQLQNIPITMEAFNGKEDILLRALIAKYGKEPPKNEDYTIIENEEMAARMQMNGWSGTSRSQSSTGMPSALQQQQSTVSKYKMNPPPPPPEYSGFARMSEGKLTQKSSIAAAAAASPPAAGGAPGATPTPPPPAPAAADLNPTSISEQVFQPPQKDEELEKSIAAKAKGWGRATDKPICEKMYYSPTVFRVLNKPPPAPTPGGASSPKKQTSFASDRTGLGPDGAPVETEEERKIRLAEQRKSRPPPPRAYLLSSEQGMFALNPPVAKMTDVEHDLVTNEIISRVHKDMNKLTNEEEPVIRAEMEAEYKDYVAKMWSRIQKDREKALKKLENRMAGHINTIHERYAFSPNTLTYSPKEKDGNPNNMYYDDRERIARREAGFEDDLFGNTGSGDASENGGSPLEKISSEEMILSDRENFLLSVLPDEKSKTKWKVSGLKQPGTGLELRSPPSWQFRARLARFVRKYIPTALDDVDVVAADHVGKEENRMAFLRAKYGPEPGGAVDAGLSATSPDGTIQVPEVANAALNVPPVARSLEELEDYVFAPGDRPVRSDDESSTWRYKRNPNFNYSGVPPNPPPTLDEELEELRRTAYTNQSDPWNESTKKAYHDMMASAEERKKLGLNSRYYNPNGDPVDLEAEKKMDPRLKEMRSLMQAMEASTNALVFEDPRWMGEENLPKEFWDVIEHREADEDDDLLRGGIMLSEKLNEAEKLGIPKEEFMKIERERAERRRKERERTAKELHDAKIKMRELEEQQNRAEDDAREAKRQLELAKIEAEEKVAAANRRIEETRAQVNRELRALEEKNKQMQEESVRRERDLEGGMEMQQKMVAERLREKENQLAEREKEVDLRLHEAEEREAHRAKLEDERRKRERKEIEQWREKAQKRVAPTISDAVQTDPIIEKKKQLVDSEVQMLHSPVAATGIQTSNDVVVIADPTEVEELMEIKYQNDPDISLLEAIKRTYSPERQRYDEYGNPVSLDHSHHHGSPSPRRPGFNDTAEQGTQSMPNEIKETRTRDVQTPDFQGETMRLRLKMAEVELQEQNARSKLQLQAYETSPRFLPRSQESMKSPRGNNNNNQSNNFPMNRPSPLSQLQQGNNNTNPSVTSNTSQHLSPTSSEAAPKPGSTLLKKLLEEEKNKNASAGTSAPAAVSGGNQQPQPNMGHRKSLNTLNSTFTFPQNLEERNGDASSDRLHQHRPPEITIENSSLAGPSFSQNIPVRRSGSSNQSSPHQQTLQPNTSMTARNPQLQQQMQAQPLQQKQSSSSFVAPESATVEEYHDRVRLLYKKYAPQKTDNAVDIILNRYSGEERTLLTSLMLKYGPEPTGQEAEQLRQKMQQEEAEKQAKLRAHRNQQLLLQQQQAAAGSASSSRAPSNNNLMQSMTPYSSSSRMMNNNQQQSQLDASNQQQRPDSELYLEPVDFQAFFQRWEIAPALMPVNSQNSTPRLAACKLTPEDLFLFPSLEPSAARRAAKRQIAQQNQLEQQANGRNLYSDHAAQALQDVAARVFYYSNVMYWCPPRNPSWKYVIVTGREIIIGDDDNHVKHRIPLVGSPSETVSLSVILYQGPGAVEGDDSPCVLVIRTGTPPTSRVWTSDVDPSGNNTNHNSSSSSQQQDILLFFPSGLQARKSDKGGASSSRHPIQGRFAALRAQRLMCAIEFAIQTEGPIAAATSKGSLVTSPVSTWTLKSNNPNFYKDEERNSAGVDETAYLLEKAASDLCGLRYSSTAGSSSFGGGNVPLRPPPQSISDNTSSNIFQPPSYMNKMPLAQAHYNKRLHGAHQSGRDDLDYDDNNDNYYAAAANRGSRNNSPPSAADSAARNQQHRDPYRSTQAEITAGLTPDQLQRLARVDQRAEMHAAEREARQQKFREENSLASLRGNDSSNPINQSFGPPSKPTSRWGATSPGGRNNHSNMSNISSSRPIDPATQNVLGLINSATRKGNTPQGSGNNMRWIQDSVK